MSSELIKPSFTETEKNRETGTGDAQNIEPSEAKAHRRSLKSAPAKREGTFLESFAPPININSTGVVDKFVAVNTDNYQWIPNNSVDLILTDPPFNIAQDTNFHTWKENTINSYRFDEDKGWDTYEHPQFVELIHSWAAEFARVLKPGGHFAVFCADSYLSHLMEGLEAAGLKPRRTLTWQKPNAVPINRQTMMMSACEYVVVGVKGSKATFNSDIKIGDTDLLTDVGALLIADKAANIVEKSVREALTLALASSGVITPEVLAAIASDAIKSEISEVDSRVQAMFSTNEDGVFLRGCLPNYVSLSSKAGSNRIHPTEKPVPLLRYLISLLSNPGDVVLDPFAGSGSTGEAALDRNRRVLLVERETDFYEAVVKRLSEHGKNEVPKKQKARAKKTVHVDESDEEYLF